MRWAQESPEPSGPRYVCATSVHGLVEACGAPRFRRILNNASVVTPDGMPLVWVGRIMGHKDMTRVYGPDLTKVVCQLSACLPVRHYFYGGGEGVAVELAKRLRQMYPGLDVVGTSCPLFHELTDCELAEVTDTINKTDPDIVWVGLSTPKQERFIDSARPYLKAKVLLSVGAAFDFHTGRVKQAPAWMQRIGLEWLFRLMREPRRLWRRYAYIVPRFVILVLLQLLHLRRYHADADRG